MRRFLSNYFDLLLYYLERINDDDDDDDDDDDFLSDITSLVCVQQNE